MSCNAFLTYNKWNGDMHTGTLLDHKGLSVEEIQNAIDNYIENQSAKNKEIKRLNSLVDKLLLERDCYKKYYEIDFEKRNSGY